VERKVVEGETGQYVTRTAGPYGSMVHGFVVSCLEGAMFIDSFDVNYGHML